MFGGVFGKANIMNSLFINALPSTQFLTFLKTIVKFEECLWPFHKMYPAMITHIYCLLFF